MKPKKKKKIHRRNPPVNLTLPPALVAWAKEYAADNDLKYMSALVARELSRLRSEHKRR